MGEIMSEQTVNASLGKYEPHPDSYSPRVFVYVKATYHTGHWDWIAPWGYTWVDDSGKTCIWNVCPTIGNAAALGQVRWYGPWRRYVFYPNANTLYDYACLQDIAEFCHTNTRSHNA
jgi:hypothetical protein